MDMIEAIIGMIALTTIGYMTWRGLDAYAREAGGGGGEMNGSDCKKLLRAGFRIFRRHRWDTYRIMELSHNGGWKLVSSHASKADMERAWCELMRNDDCIGDISE